VEPSKEVREQLIRVDDFSFYYGEKQALFDINMAIAPKEVTALIGPSGCGKSTLLRSINRMNDLVDGARHEGDIVIKDKSVFSPEIEVISLRKRIGMVFQKSNPFSKSIYENVIFGLRIAGQNDRKKLDEVVESSLRNAALWDEVKDRLNSLGSMLSGGQQQRAGLCRALMLRPDLLLLDEPFSGLDTMTRRSIHEQFLAMRESIPISTILVTHDPEEAIRLAEFIVILRSGTVQQFGQVQDVIDRPANDYVRELCTGITGTDK